MQDDAFNREWIEEMTAQRDRILSSGVLARVGDLAGARRGGATARRRCSSARA